MDNYKLYFPYIANYDGKYNLSYVLTNNNTNIYNDNYNIFNIDEYKLLIHKNYIIINNNIVKLHTTVLYFPENIFDNEFSDKEIYLERTLPNYSQFIVHLLNETNVRLAQAQPELVQLPSASTPTSTLALPLTSASASKQAVPPTSSAIAVLEPITTIVAKAQSEPSTSEPFLQADIEKNKESYEILELHSPLYQQLLDPTLKLYLNNEYIIYEEISDLTPKKLTIFSELIKNDDKVKDCSEKINNNLDHNIGICDNDIEKIFNVIIYFCFTKILFNMKYDIILFFISESTSKFTEMYNSIKEKNYVNKILLNISLLKNIINEQHNYINITKYYNVMNIFYFAYNYILKYYKNDKNIKFIITIYNILNLKQNSVHLPFLTFNKDINIENVIDIKSYEKTRGRTYYILVNYLKILPINNNYILTLEIVNDNRSVLSNIFYDYLGNDKIINLIEYLIMIEQSSGGSIHSLVKNMLGGSLSDEKIIRKLNNETIRNKIKSYYELNSKKIKNNDEEYYNKLHELYISL